MEWPYDHPRRGDMPPGRTPSRSTSTTIRKPPYAQGHARTSTSTRTCRAGAARTTRRTSWSTRRSTRTPARNYAWVRARVPRRQDEHLGPPRAAPLRLRLQGEEPRRLRRGLADLLRRHRALLRQGRPLPRHLRPQGRPAASARQPLPAPDTAERRPRSSCASRMARSGRVLTPYRAGVTTDGLKHNKYRSKLLRPRRLRPARRRLRHPRRLRLAHRPHLSGHGHRPPHAAHRLASRARSPSTRRRARRAASPSSTPRPAQSSRRGEGRRARRVHARVGAPAAALEVRAAPERHRQLERPRRPQLLRARDGPGRRRASSRTSSASRARSTTAGPAASTSRASATSRTSSPTSSAATASRAAAAPACSPTAPARPGFGAAYKKEVRDDAGAFIGMGGFGEVLPRYENAVSIDPEVKDTLGHPGPALRLQVRRQREEDGRRHGRHRRRRCSRRPASRSSSVDQRDPHRGLVDPRAGHGAHGQRSEDLGAEPVPAVARREEPVRRGRQQPRERVVPEPDLDDHGALAWRSCDHLADELRKGNL